MLIQYLKKCSMNVFVESSSIEQENVVFGAKLSLIRRMEAGSRIGVSLTTLCLQLRAQSKD